jgi:6-phosphogluconolactonase
MHLRRRAADPATDEPELLIADDADDASAVAAERIAELLGGAVSMRGRADWVTTGGSTPTGIYRRLVAQPLRESVPWDRVRLWWGDDRFVPRDHPLSNVFPADHVLLAGDGVGQTGLATGVPIPPNQVHPYPIGEAIASGLPPAAAAVAAERTLRELAEIGALEVADGYPVFDVVLVGIGPDGHLLSVFPGSAVPATLDRWVIEVPAPSHVEPHVPRITMHPGVLGSARHVVAVAHGGAKAGILGRILAGPRDPEDLPGQFARLARATWVLDAAAAAQLGG